MTDDGWLPHDSGYRVPWQSTGGPIPLHVDEVGRPIPCNAYCQPDQLIHAQISYTNRTTDLYQIGDVVNTVHGRAIVISSDLAPEAPRCPTLPNWHPLLTIWRYYTDTRLHPYTPTSPR